MPPSLTVVNTDSLGEQIQRAFPTARVVKTLNTVTAQLMVNPRLVGDGDHTMFVCGDDPDAKALVTGLLTEGLGWRDVVDLGDITAARGAEMVMAAVAAADGWPPDADVQLQGRPLTASSP